jgi:uncharacterized UBP type Zn finger protein
VPSCNTREDIVICLVCGSYGCGREQPGQHALEHHDRTGHTLTMALNNGAVFCYKCDEWVVTDNAMGSILVRRRPLQ